MTLQELIDTECNRVFEEVCARLGVKTSDALSRSINTRFVIARRDTVQALFALGFRKADIARTLKCHHATVKYWIDDDTRDRRRTQCSEYQSQRRENLRDHLRDTKATPTPAPHSQDSPFASSHPQ